MFWRREKTQIPLGIDAQTLCITARNPVNISNEPSEAKYFKTSEKYYIQISYKEGNECVISCFWRLSLLNELRVDSVIQHFKIIIVSETLLR